MYFSCIHQRRGLHIVDDNNSLRKQRACPICMVMRKVLTDVLIYVLGTLQQRGRGGEVGGNLERPSVQVSMLHGRHLQFPSAGCYTYMVSVAWDNVVKYFGLFSD